MRRLIFAAALAVSVVPAGTSAYAQYCEGTVHGLSRHYDLKTGSGFLAVRARPSSKSRMVGQFFNGDTTEILDRRGNWYFVAIGGIEGWASTKWIRNSCGY